MSTFEFDQLAAVNPLSDAAADCLDIRAAENEMLGQITTHAVAGDHRRASRPGRTLVFSRRIAVVLAAAAAALAIFAVLPSDHHDGGPPPAFAAVLVRFANASPLVLFEDPAWHIVYADEESHQSGEIQYKTGNGKAFADLSWQGGSLAAWQKDRRGQSSMHVSVPILGGTGQAYRYTRSSEYSVVWGHNGLVMEFSEVAPSMAAFKAMLTKLHRVDATTWLRALPASVVQTADRGKVVQQMLKGIPLPPGFDASQIPGAGLVRNRYQVGAAVTGTVSCEWFRTWVRGRADGDQAEVNRAISAMATAKRWPVLQQMRRQGGWTSVVLQLAAAMPSGKLSPPAKLVGGKTRKGESFLSNVDSSLGCSSEWGVPLRQ